MRSLRRMITLPMFLVVSAAFGCADTITYTFTGATGVAGTDWTLIDPSGYIPDDTPVVNLLTTSTDYFSFGQDDGPLIGIGDQGEQSGNAVCTNDGTPCFEINMAITLNGGPYVIPFFFAGTDGTSGTFTEIQTGSSLVVTDSGAGSAPEPGSAILMLPGVGLLVLILAREKGFSKQSACSVGGESSPRWSREKTLRS